MLTNTTELKTMTTKKLSEKNAIDTSEKSEKTCFIIMPIADTSGYDNGHFSRVYSHLIKPACELAGFKPIRADDVSSSHFIVVDILKKIVESDLAICDLSARNPNVLYELGLRQAFNKKTVLIKDHKTDNIFDVQGFRYAQYDSNLRVDNVKNEILKLSIALTETYEASGDINSIVQLLQIEPARIDNKTELTASDTVIFRAISDLKNSIEKLTNESDDNLKNQSLPHNSKRLNLISRAALLGLEFDEVYFKKNSKGTEFGTFIEVSADDNRLVFEHSTDGILSININDPILLKIENIPY
jgi:hypothetical protein